MVGMGLKEVRRREREKNTEKGTICSVTLYFLSWERGKRAVKRNTCYLITVSWMSCALCRSPHPLPDVKILIHLVCRSHYSGVWLLDMGLDNCLLSIKCFCCLSTLSNWYFSHSCATEKRQHCCKNRNAIPAPKQKPAPPAQTANCP